MPSNNDIASWGRKAVFDHYSNNKPFGNEPSVYTAIRDVYKSMDAPIIPINPPKPSISLHKKNYFLDKS